jgi:hypothetical protein
VTKLVARLRVGHFVIRFPSSKDEMIEMYGSERITYVLCKQLSKMSCDVHVFAPSNRGLLKKIDEITIHLYPSQFRL